ncbi:hypothetical protein Leryth_026563 [Lithospermum erythrorhizon]|nr:hypothetical protein Leryth_026563 [Lithospermum erythrorhizon]
MYGASSLKQADPLGGSTNMGPDRLWFIKLGRQQCKVVFRVKLFSNTCLIVALQDWRCQLSFILVTHILSHQKHFRCRISKEVSLVGKNFFFREDLYLDQIKLMDEYSDHHGILIVVVAVLFHI